MPASREADTPTRGVPMDGSVRLRFDGGTGTTRLADLYQQAPLRAFFPDGATDGECEAVLGNVAGGLVGGDRLSVNIEAASNGRALITTQAAEKVYRSAGPAVRVDCELAVSSGGSLAWMPQPTILFDGADLRRRTRISVEPDATLLAGEVLVLGREGYGERLATGHLYDAWEVCCGGKLVWADRMVVRDWQAVRDDPGCIAGARASALFVNAGASIPDRLDTARTIVADCGDNVVAGATMIDGLLIVRWLGRDAKALLEAYAEFWRCYRATADAPGRIPRIWAV